jgi:hypothetical protein
MSSALVGCVAVAQEPPMCELEISFDGKDEHGDNWLPVGGLPSGKSIEFKVKPGKYKAVWTTCKKPNKAYYAATRWRESAFDVVEPTQLFAYVASNVAPTSIAPPLAHHKMVRFAGQSIDPTPGRPGAAQPQIAAVAPPKPTVMLMPNIAIVLPEVQVEIVLPRLDPRELNSWIDPKLVAEARARAAKNPRIGVAAAKTAAPAPAVKPSAARGHDVASQAVGYKMR